MSEARHFENAPTAVSAARHFVIDLLSDVPRGVVDEVAVMVSELVTNCVRHTESEFTVAVEQDRRRVRVEVTDGGPGTPTLRVPDADEPTGRGLRIVRELADSFGVETATDGPGKTVWFVVELAAGEGDRAPRAGARARNTRRP